MRSAIRLMAVLTVVAASLVSPVLTSAPAQHADAADLRFFDPGNIISDAVFFDGRAMDAGAIQSFLDSKVRGSCPDPRFDSSPCLKDFSMETSSRAADNLCSGYQGAARESAAVVIAKVATSCRVSPRVLLVLLEKEMSFITSSNPTAKMYNRAAGYGCPDNVGGWCDPAQAGLQNQLYRSAWQFQRYAAYPGSYGFRAGRSNTIGYYPAVRDDYGDNRYNARCGTSTVYIQNQATAGLYNYTPYRPNQAALDAGYGTGNTCSSYGNRNFFHLFTDWFGSTQSSGGTAIVDRGRAPDAARIGRATSGTNCGLLDGRCFRAHEFGAIYWSPTSGAHLVYGEIHKRWAGLGWETSRLGYPTGSETCGLRDGGCLQTFQDCAIYWSPATGAQPVLGAIRTKWAAAQWETGPLGYPLTAEAFGLADGGCYQRFQGGEIHSTQATGTRIVRGSILTAWVQQGREKGQLGYPTGPEVCGLADRRCRQHFQGGTIITSPTLGTYVVWGAIGEVWVSKPATFGYPTSGEICGLVGGGCFQVFQKTHIYWSPATGAHAVAGQIFSTWGAQGWERGSLGYPTGPAVTTSSTITQPFQGGTLVQNRSTGTVTRR